MLPKYFRPHVEAYNKRWLAQALAIHHNGHLGIDLLTERFGIELKCRMIGYGRRVITDPEQLHLYPIDNPGREFYWAFLYYKLSKPVRQIKEREDLEDLITKREVWCLPWEWMSQFPETRPSQKSGPYRYVSATKFPDAETMTVFTKKRKHLFGEQIGTIYVPKGSHLEAYLINKELISAQEEDQDKGYIDPEYIPRTVRDFEQVPIKAYESEAKLQRDLERQKIQDAIQDRRDAVWRAYNNARSPNPKKSIVEMLAREHRVSMSTIYRDLNIPPF